MDESYGRGRRGISRLAAPGIIEGHITTPSTRMSRRGRRPVPAYRPRAHSSYTTLSAAPH